VNEEVSNNEAEDKKKKQISMLLRVVVILGIVYLAGDYFLSMNNDSIPKEANVSSKTHKSPNKTKHLPGKSGATPEKALELSSELTNMPAKVLPEIKKPEEQIPKVKEEALQAVETFPANVAVVNNVEVMDVEIKKNPDVQAPIENINIANNEIKEVAAPATPIMPVETKEPAVEQVSLNENKIDKSIDSLIDEVDKGHKPDEYPVKKIKLEDKIIEEDIYIPPAPYDQLGRGLVYNCKEKYWACINKAAYVICNKNMKWNKNHGKPAECAVQSVYGSDDDCATVQKYNVSVSKIALSCD
jgi:hypothetical protein